MTPTLSVHEKPTLVIEEEIRVDAPLAATFESLLIQMGPQNESPDGKPLPMVLEAKPGGRWFRDLGHGAGHLWGFVQSIRPPALLEIWGPLFISTGASSNLIYRLSDVDGATVVAFKHSLVGPVPDEMGEHMGPGWAVLHARVKRAAETGGKPRSG